MPLPLGGGGDLIWGKIMKRGRKIGGKCKRKKKEKRENGK
jgi:hypothetical protein